MRGTKAQRLLLRQDVAKELQAQTRIGVPIQCAMRNLDITCSRPTVVKLLDALNLADTNEKAASSIFPVWLDKEGTVLQSQPEGWAYVGRFPLGEWQCSNT